MSDMEHLIRIIDAAVKHKTLSETDFEQVKTALSLLEGNALRRAVIAVGYTFNKQNANVLEPYLYYEADTSVAAEALKGLTWHFRLALDYCEYVKAALLGLSWDDWLGTVRNEAILAAGRILQADPSHHQLADDILRRLRAGPDSLEGHGFAVLAAGRALGLTPRQQVELRDVRSLTERFATKFSP